MRVETFPVGVIQPPKTPNTFKVTNGETVGTKTRVDFSPLGIPTQDIVPVVFSTAFFFFFL